MPISDYGGGEVLASAIDIYIKLSFFSNTPFLHVTSGFHCHQSDLLLQPFLG